MISAVAGTSRSRSGTNQSRLSFQEENRKRSLSQVEVHRVARGNQTRVIKAELFNSDEHLELVGRTHESKNWGGMIISIMVIILICSAIVIVAIFVSENKGYYLIKPFEFEDVFNESRQEKEYRFQWLNESQYASKDSDNNIILMDLQHNHSIILLDNRTWNVEGASEFIINPTGEYILLVCHKEMHYRYSYTAVYKVYNISEKRVLPALLPTDVMDESPRLRYAGWSPDKSQPSLVFVYKNDIYYQKGVSGTPTPITTSGEEDLIYNGVPDYALEGDLIDSNNAIYWYPKGGRLVYATFNDTGVDQAFVTKYDYLTTPMVEFFPYPTPSGKLPTVTLHVVDLETLETTQLQPPTEIADQDHFYKYVAWVSQDLMSVTWLNRAQDYCVVTICDTDTGLCQKSIDQRTENGWVVNRGTPLFSEDGLSYALIWPLWDESAKDKHYHVHVTSQENGRWKIEAWTEGDYEVTKIISYRKWEQVVYFLANGNATWDSHLYRVIRGADVECLSCDINPITCTHYDAEVIKDTSKYVLHCRGPGVPKTTLHDFDQDPLQYQLLENNTDFYNEVYSKVHLEQESHWFNVKGVQLPVRIMYHNRKDMNRPHPLLINIMDDPGSKMVKSEFYQGWFTYLASEYHVITANIDFRGTSGAGQNHLYANNNRFGTVDVDDIILVTEYLRNSSLGVVSFNQTQFDQNKVAIMGSSYGGFLSSMAYAKSPFFNCSIAVSPVTDWRHHDAILTEKFMNLPTAEDNLHGYKDANVSSQASRFRNNTFLIVHGMADKSVHFQHSANLVKALANENIRHQTLFYPDEGHDLYNSKVKEHLYQSMTDFLVQCLQLGVEES